ncbi:MAG: small basic protein [Candidatus Omnitrophota bacterium]|nr:small basic protein [Candidatus Omnitrophota bacterium]
MSLHPSLKRAERMTASRSVMNRSERIKWLLDKGLWKEGDRVLGLPKIKVIKLKAVKKEKVKKDAASAEGTATPAPADKTKKTSVGKK